MGGVAADPLIRAVLREESFTRGLEDTEARMLVEWVVEWTELLVGATKTDEEAKKLVKRLCRRSRAIARFVQLWTDHRTRASAVQLAATERFTWPLPTVPLSAPDLMEQVLNWENLHSVC